MEAGGKNTSGKRKIAEAEQISKYEVLSWTAQVLNLQKDSCCLNCAEHLWKANFTEQEKHRVTMTWSHLKYK